MKFDTIRLFVRKRHTSSALVILRISLQDDLKVLALSEISVTSSPRRLANRLKTNRNVWTLRSRVISKWTARAYAQVNRHTYTLLDSFALSVLFLSPINSALAKSRPTWVKGGSSETLLLGRSEDGWDLYCVPSYRRQITHFLIICLTASRPRKIQNRSLDVTRVSRIPLCLVNSCMSLMTSRTNWCFAGNRIGLREFGGRLELLSRPLHLTIPVSKNNPKWDT